jgi:hypothetical protein
MILAPPAVKATEPTNVTTRPTSSAWDAKPGATLAKTLSAPHTNAKWMRLIPNTLRISCPSTLHMKYGLMPSFPHRLSPDMPPAQTPQLPQEIQHPSAKLQSTRTLPQAHLTTTEMSHALKGTKTAPTINTANHHPCQPPRATPCLSHSNHTHKSPSPPPHRNPKDCHPRQNQHLTQHSHLTMNNTTELDSMTLKIWQQNLNTSRSAQLSLLNHHDCTSWDILALQEPYTNPLNNTTANCHYHVVYPTTRYTDSSKRVRAVTLISNLLNANTWT